MFNFLANMRYRAKLSLAFLLLSIIPLAAIGSFLQISFSQNIEEHVFDKLVSIRDSKKSEIEQHLQSIQAQAKIFSTSSHVRYSISRYFGFAYAFNIIDKDPKIAAQKLAAAKLLDKGFYSLSPQFQNQSDGYAGVHFRFDGGYQDFVKSSDFSNLLLITPAGQVVYTSQKGQYFAADLTDQQLTDTALAVAFARIKQRYQAGVKLNKIVEMVDFSWDRQVQQEVAYLAFPIIQHNRFSGVIVFTLPLQSITAITARRDGLGETGEAYLLGADLLPRSELAAQRHNAAQYSLESLTKANRPLQSAAARAALAGKSGYFKDHSYVGTATLAAFDNIQFLNNNWALIVDISAGEALQKSVYFTKLIIAIGVIITTLIAVIVYYLSASMTKPLYALMLATERVSKGNLQLSIRGSSRRDELGSLARSFVKMQHSIRQQISQIHDVNAQLEDKVQTIEIQNTELHAADKLKDEFLANTSHELRTPLHGIIGIIESLSDGAAGELSHTQQLQLNMVASSANRLSLLVDDLLDFHKIRHNQLRVNIIAVNTTTLVAHIVELTKVLVADKDIVLIQQLPEDLPKVLADPVRFEQILYNLLGNAIKYTHSGQIIISASVVAEQVQFKVCDTGIGMNSADLDHIFKPFEQADGGITRKIGGSGLGLSISKKLVELMQGTMDVESVEHSGSSFFFYLPLAPADDSHSSDILPQQKSPDTEFIDYIEPERLANFAHVETQTPLVIEQNVNPSGECILVVDDEQINLQILHNHLTLSGYQVLLAQDAEQAFKLLQEQDPALIILDVMLPGVSGFEIARQVRKQYDLYALPILMLTARTQSSDLVEGFNSGANDYVVKPFLKDELLSRVATLLQARQAVNRLQENIRLKEEVARRLETEQQLRNSQRSMLQMLDSIEDTIITFNSFDHIAYYNQAAYLQLGYSSDEMIGKNIEQLVDLNQLAQIRSKLLKIDRGSIDLSICRNDGSSILRHAFIARVGGFRCDDIAIILRQPDEKDNRSNLPAIEQALLAAQQIIDTEGIAALVLEQHALDHPQPDDLSLVHSHAQLRQQYRHLLVDSMNDSLALWELASGLGKIDLAEQSKLWRGYMDRSSLQTRTLDKYFLEETLPLKPRWRDVLRTGNYVLKHIDNLQDEQRRSQLNSHPQYLRLKQNLVGLKNHLGK
ncbi:MAG: hypothetical protein OFPI_06990 [Osedax symbiont Rs2]|nr:MAG: hypothetical protein OFPI_06990 [Osedax symbiont Rs2]